MHRCNQILGKGDYVPTRLSPVFFFLFFLQVSLEIMNYVLCMSILITHIAGSYSNNWRMFLHKLQIAAYIECECISTNDGKYTKQNVEISHRFEVSNSFKLFWVSSLFCQYKFCRCIQNFHMFILLQAMGGLYLRMRVTIVYCGVSVDTYSSGFSIFQC